jgi:hypothetical protein
MASYQKTGQTTNRAANSNRPDLPNWTDEFEIHRSRIESSFYQKFHSLPKRPRCAAAERCEGTQEHSDSNVLLGALMTEDIEPLIL